MSIGFEPVEEGALMTLLGAVPVNGFDTTPLILSNTSSLLPVARTIIFSEVKMSLWNTMLDASACAGVPVSVPCSL